MNIKKSILSCMLLLGCGLTQAHDFVISVNGQDVYFNVKSKKNKTAMVTYRGSIAAATPTDYQGELVIPGKVKHDSIVYSVVGIGAKAFSGAEKLTGIVLPMGMTSIGDFAFEGCTSLSKIVFPGNEVKFGQGVFFRCDKIQHVSLGSDWKSIDLQMFRWSDSLSTLPIPAKVQKIRNMKSLKRLESINVDANNERFASVDGVLYNKNKEVLYGCPRAYTGTLRVLEGTKKITSGALVDCVGISRVDLSGALEYMSFREFSRMKSLQEIIFRRETPIPTAMNREVEVFLLQVANPEVQIIVPKKSQKFYQNALIKQEGEYTEVDGKIPFMVEIDELPDVANVKGVRDFNKYEQ